MIDDVGVDFDVQTTTKSDPLVYTLVANGFATYNELKEYSIDEVITLYEICLVHSYNKAMVAKTVQKEQNGRVR